MLNCYCDSIDIICYFDGYSTNGKDKLVVSGWAAGSYTIKIYDCNNPSIYTTLTVKIRGQGSDSDSERYIILEKDSYEISVGETAIIRAVNNDPGNSGYRCHDPNNCFEILSRNTEFKENGELVENVTIKGLRPGTAEIEFSVGDSGQVTKTASITVTAAPDVARELLRDYILTTGKEVTSGSGIIGDYYIESRSVASSRYNRIVISAFLDDSCLVMYSMASDKTQFILFHNQQDQQVGVDNFQYYTNETDDSIYHFTLSYWGNITINQYAAGLYGNEQGIYDCKKNGPVVVTDQNELYKVYRKASDSMKEFDDFIKDKMGFGLNAFGYEKM